MMEICLDLPVSELRTPHTTATLKSSRQRAPRREAPGRFSLRFAGPLPSENLHIQHSVFVFKDLRELELYAVGTLHQGELRANSLAQHSAARTMFWGGRALLDPPEESPFHILSQSLPDP